MKTSQLNNIQKIGQAFASFLDDHREEIHLKSNADGRLESLESEDSIRDLLIKNFSDKINFLEKDHNRSFGDMDIELDGVVYPINIKMVDPIKSGTYNGGGVKVINHMLFGLKDSNFSRVAKRIKSQSASMVSLKDDYYYLVFFKRSEMTTKFAALSELSPSSVVTNPSNPIQLKTNLETVARTESEKVEFIIGLFREVCLKKAQAYLILEGKAA
mgnify:CR=1 FL=1|tara:strand:- start:2147 stop:2791 length:645 start_codon:yes stop_codon:yes gene_type:complete